MAEHKEQVMNKVIELSRWLGDENRGYAILGEGNTSAKIDNDSFYVKASGSSLSTMTENGMVEVSFAKVLDMLDGPALSDNEIKSKLLSATINNPAGLWPSVETLFHAYLLTLPDVNFVGHTHPISVNAITCSKDWKEATSGRLFPDEIVCCGVAPAYIDYTDPGVTLARHIREAVQNYIDQYGMRPKSILLQNHGLIALGSSINEVQSVTAMWDKTAKVLAGTYRFGGPNYLTDEHVNRICTRPDEAYRKKLIEGKK